jgi:outer membrane lipopolysaccharide assembly protein LptE/RlpB
MKHKKAILRPLGPNMQDTYTRSELLALCESMLFTKAKRMDTLLLKELLYALDERPDEEAAPHQSIVWAKISARIQSRTRRPRRKVALVALLIALALILAGCGLIWAFHLGVLSFPSAALRQYPSVETNAAQSLVQTDLYSAQYEHCEFRVREATYDGYQLRIVYSLRDTRDNAALTDSDLYMSSIAAAQLDGIGCCDYLIVDGRDDVYLDDTFQLPGEENAEMLYYISANIPKEMQVSDVITVKMPIGELDLETRTRLHNDVIFTVDATQAAKYALSAEPVTVIWDNLQVEVTRADFSPLNGLVQVIYRAVDADQPYTRLELRLFTPDGEPVGYQRPASYSGADASTNTIITQYIPDGDWPEQMVLAPMLADDSMDADHMIPLKWTEK